MKLNDQVTEQKVHIDQLQARPTHVKRQSLVPGFDEHFRKTYKSNPTNRSVSNHSELPNGSSSSSEEAVCEPRSISTRSTKGQPPR